MLRLDRDATSDILTLTLLTGRLVSEKDKSVGHGDQRVI